MSDLCWSGITVKIDGTRFITNMTSLQNSFTILYSHKLKVLLVLMMLTVATILRLYNLPNTLIFQADQARDALIVSKIFTEGKPVFIGPVTSVGNMYLGPLYYYFMLPFLALSYPSPLGPAYGIAFLSIVTIFLFYYVGTKLLGSPAGLISATMASCSTVLIYFSRFSWNPNPVPFVSLLMVYLTYMAWKKDSTYWIGVAICFGVLLQLHYITLIMFAGACFFWLLSLHSLIKMKDRNSFKNEFISFLKITGISVFVLVISFSPLILFDARHDWVNLKAFQSIFTSEKILSNSSEFKFKDLLFGIFRESHGRTIEVLFTLFFGKVTQIQNYLLCLILGYLFYFATCRNKIPHWNGQFVVLIYLLLSIAGISAYKRSIFDHYLLFIIPMSLLFWGSVFTNFYTYLLGKVGLILFLFIFFWYNLSHLPLTSQGWTIYRVKNVTDEILTQLHPGEKYDVVLLSESGDFYALNYRYFLNASTVPPIRYDFYEPVSTLVIINENRKNKSSDMIPVYQIQVFGKPNEIKKTVHEDGPNIEIWRK